MAITSLFLLYWRSHQRIIHMIQHTTQFFLAWSIYFLLNQWPQIADKNQMPSCILLILCLGHFISPIAIVKIKMYLAFEIFFICHELYLMNVFVPSPWLHFVADIIVYSWLWITCQSHIISDRSSLAWPSRMIWSVPTWCSFDLWLGVASNKTTRGFRIPPSALGYACNICRGDMHILVTTGSLSGQRKQQTSSCHYH